MSGKSFNLQFRNELLLECRIAYKTNELFRKYYNFIHSTLIHLSLVSLNINEAQIMIFTNEGKHLEKLKVSWFPVCLSCKQLNKYIKHWSAQQMAKRSYQNKLYLPSDTEFMHYGKTS